MTYYEQVGYSVRGLANWILDFSEHKGYSQSNMAINKLVYFAVKAILLREHRLLTRAKIEAWEHGPVFRELYHDFKAAGDGPVRTRAKSFDRETHELVQARIELTEHDASSIEEAITPLLSLTASQLRALSHVEGDAWHRVWSYKGRTNPGMEITPLLILESAAGSNGGDGEIP